MTPTLQITQTLRRLERAANYLRLMEKCKEMNRYCMRESIAVDPDDIFSMHRYYAKRAQHYAGLYRYIQDRYNQCVCDSLIIAPHMITT